MKKLVQDLIVTGFGLVSSLLTVVLLILVEEYFNIALYTWMLWLVVPVGAVLAGFAAASGYYLGSWLFNHRPDKLVLLNMVAVALGAYVLIEYIHYLSVTYEGQSISSLISFPTYLDASIRSTSMKFSYRGAHQLGSTGELGSWGYAVALIQVLGFSLGGLSIYAYLTSLIYCEKCSKYFSAKGKTYRHFSSDAGALNKSYKEVALYIQQHIESNNREQTSAEGARAPFLEEAISICLSSGTAAEGASKIWPQLQLAMILRFCKSCLTHYFKFYAAKKKDAESEWDDIDGTTIEIFTNAPLSLEQHSVERLIKT